MTGQVRLPVCVRSAGKPVTTHHDVPHLGLKHTARVSSRGGFHSPGDLVIPGGTTRPVHGVGAPDPSTTTGCRWGSQVTHHVSSPAARRPGGRFLHGRNGHQAFQGGPLSTRDHPAPRFLLHHGPVIDGACASEDPSQPGRRIVHKMRRGLQAAFVLCRPLVTGPSPVRTIRFTTSPSATPEAGCIMPGMSPSDRTSFACLRDPRCGSTMPFGSGRHARSRTARR